MKSALPTRIALSLRRGMERPGMFYGLLILAVVAIQGLSLLALLQGGELVRTAIPAYAHVLAVSLGSIFLFRGLQLLGALIWTRLMCAPIAPRPYTSERADLPVVTVQIPVRNEPLEVARLSIDCALALEYPADRLEIQVIDNSSSEEFARPIREYLELRTAEVMGGDRRPDVVFLHREGLEGFKARNLNLGMSVAKGSFFLILDADSIVPPDVLWKALPYFEDAELGFLQMRIDAVNEDANIVTKAAAITTRARYTLMAVRNTQGVVQFDGHNGVFRREALERVGGWVEQISEDLATSVKVVLAGYRSRYAEIPSGELVPRSFSELAKQRKRWARGTMLFLKRDALAILASPRLRWFEKVDLFYAVLNIFVEGLAFLLIFTFAPLPATTTLQVLLVFSLLPTFLTVRSGLWTALVRQAGMLVVISAVLPSLVQGAVEGLRGSKPSFAITGKLGEGQLAPADLLRTNALGFSMAIAFFVITALLAGSLSQFLNSYLAGGMMMGAVLVSPILLNYTAFGRRQTESPDREDRPDVAGATSAPSGE